MVTNPWILLGLAIVSEVIGTSALKSAEGFTRLGPSLLVGVSYGLAFWLLSLSLRTIPVGVAYAVWSGAGIALVSLIAWLALGQRLDAPALAGIGLIVAGVAVIQVFSTTASH